MDNLWYPTLIFDVGYSSQIVSSSSSLFKPHFDITYQATMGLHTKLPDDLREVDVIIIGGMED